MSKVLTGRSLVAAVGAAMVVVTLAGSAGALTESERQVLATRMAQVDALKRLAEKVRSAHVDGGLTVGEVVDRDAEKAIALRVFLRSARVVGEPRHFSDGVTEADVEISLDVVVQEVRVLCGLMADSPPELAELRDAAIDGLLRVVGAGRAPADVELPVVRAVLATPMEELPAMFAVGWQSVQPSGRVQAARAARVRAYEAMVDGLAAVRPTEARGVRDVVAGWAAAEALLDAFVRSLPTVGQPRLMPDCVAEVTVLALVRDLVTLLKDIRALDPDRAGWTEKEIDQLSVRLKTDELRATGRGMPAPRYIRPATAPEVAVPLPDWAAEVLEVEGTARPSDDVGDARQARLLASRAAKARALVELEKRLDQVALDDGRTVRQRGTTDKVFSADVRALLAGARVVASRAMKDGRWQVVLCLPLERLYHVSRRPDPSAKP